MKVNNTDIRKYDAKQLTVDIQPPSIYANHEWIDGAAIPTEFETEVKMGHLKLSIYFKGESRNNIIRTASEFMRNFTKSCDLELDGYKGKYRGFMTANDYNKTIAKDRYVLNLEFDGFFYDEELEIVIDGKTTASFYKLGSRNAPCIVEIHAKSALTNYTIGGFGDSDIVVESLEKGKTVVIDGNAGLVTIDGANAFETVNLWEFPKLVKEETTLTFSSAEAEVKIRYMPMWI